MKVHDAERLPADIFHCNEFLSTVTLAARELSIVEK
jgi:heterodisulfide reductase subunit B